MWLRNNQVDILRYLPSFLGNDPNFASVAKVCDEEHEAIRQDAQDILNQLFVNTATWGLKYYEANLNIIPSPTDTYDLRRQRILARYQANQASTLGFMTSIVQSYSFSGSGKITPEYDRYSFTVNAADDCTSWNDLIAILNIYKPAHLAMYFAIRTYLDMVPKYTTSEKMVVTTPHVIWNRGNAKPAMWNGNFNFDRTLIFNGIAPDSDVRLFQHHDLMMNTVVRIEQSATLVNVLDGSWELNGSHILAGSRQNSGAIINSCSMKDLNTNIATAI